MLNPDLGALTGFIALAPGLAEDLHHPLAELGQVRAQGDQHLRCDTLTSADNAEQEVFGADVLVAELQRFTERKLQRLPGPRSERG